MLGQFASVKASGLSSENRIFVYEVAGLRQNDRTDSNAYPVRSSDTMLLQVPYSRMNDEMRRITRLGGTIVSVRPLNQDVPPTQSASKAASGN